MLKLVGMDVNGEVTYWHNDVKGCIVTAYVDCIKHNGVDDQMYGFAKSFDGKYALFVGSNLASEWHSDEMYAIKDDQKFLMMANYYASEIRGLCEELIRSQPHEYEHRILKGLLNI